MKKTLFFPLRIGLCTLGCFYSNSIQAQVTTDGTVNTQINQNGNVAEITGGETRGSNLFHSFQDFSVGKGNEAFFNNANEISNIFSRVTGGNISNIDGLIRANGSASLFLINPAGIIFGENARLNIGGSFYSSSASSILFENGEFSALELENSPLLTVNIPIGLSFRDEPKDIINRSTVQNTLEEVIGLEVTSGNNLAFVGGNLNFEGGNLTARGGNIELGGLSEAGIVSLNANSGSLSFREDINRGDITLSNGSEVDVRSFGGGNINVNARNLNLESGERGVSRIRAGISPDSTLINAQAGDITIDVTGNISLNEGRITNNQEGLGNSGNILITTNSLSLENGSDIGSNSLGQGNAGAVNIIVLDDITVDGENSDGFFSVISSQVNTVAEGNSGDLNIFTSDLNLTNGGRINASNLGQGNAGTINLTASGDIVIDGESPNSFRSGIFSQTNTATAGNSGDLNISTSNLKLTNGGRIDASTFGQGNAGLITINASGNIAADGESSNGFVSDIISSVGETAVGDSGGINITTGDLNLTRGGLINSSTLAQGNAGAININATGNITADGESSSSLASGIYSSIGETAVGDSGGINITTTDLNLIRGSSINSSTLAQGNAGAININATGDITFDGKSSTNGFSSNIISVLGPDATGDSGNITLSGNNLNLNSGLISTSTLGQGNSGDLNISTANLNLINNATVASSTLGQGNSGDINISTSNLNLTNGGIINADTFGEGNAGLIDIIASSDITVDGEDSGGSGFRSGITSQSNTVTGDSGDINISTTNLNLTNGGRVATNTLGQGNAGLITINAADNIAADGESSGGFASGIFSTVEGTAVGNSGGINITTTELNLTQGGVINSSTFAQGNAGVINITATGNITADGEGSGGFASGIFSTVQGAAVGNSGGINITTSELNLTRGGVINSSTFARGNAEIIQINALGTIFIDGKTQAQFPSGIYSSVTPTGKGNAAGVNIDTKNLFLTNNAEISASSIGAGNAGNLNVVSDSLTLENRASLAASTPIETGGNINLKIANNLTLRENSTISARALENANGGNVTINADDGYILAFPNQNNDIIANAAEGRGGEINITTQGIFGIEARSSTPPNQTNDIDTSSEFGLQGNFSLSTPDFDPTSGLINLPASVGDASEQISQNPCQQGVGSEFRITGKGGLPPTVNQALNSEGTKVALVEAVASQQQTEETNRISSANQATEAVPAMGWIFNDRGDVTLTEYSTKERFAQHIRKQVQNSCSN